MANLGLGAPPGDAFAPSPFLLASVAAGRGRGGFPALETSFGSGDFAGLSLLR